MTSALKKKATGILTAALLLGTFLFSLPVHGEEENEKDYTFFLHAQTDYYLKNAYSGLYLDALKGKEGTQLVQRSFTGEESQRFFFSYELYAGGGPGFYLSSALDTDMWLSVDKKVNAAPVRLLNALDFKTDIKEGFSFTNNNIPFARPDDFILYKNENNNTWRLRVSHSSDQVLEIAGPSKKENAPAQTWSYVGAENQQWILESASPAAMLVEPYWQPGESAKLTLTIQNNTDEKLYIFPNYIIEKFNGNNMEDMTLPLPDQSWSEYFRFSVDCLTGEIIIIEPRETQALKELNLSHKIAAAQSPPLIPGTYRIVKEFTIFNTNRNPKKEYTISDYIDSLGESYPIYGKFIIS